MLDGFVVPHAHFRVFHGNAAAESSSRVCVDQLALLFQPRRAESVPTDLHLREFAQLEAQVKALQQQQQQLQPTPAVASRLVTVAQSAPLAECFSFYSRLFTPESFTWPDFLTIVFAKLTEHFVASDSVLVRKAILEVFRDGRAHLARVTDASKIITLIKGLSGSSDDSSTTVWALRLLETMPPLVKDDNTIRASVLRSLKSEDITEQRAAGDAARRILPLSKEMQQSVFALVVQMNSPALVDLIAVCFDGEDCQRAEQAWNYCATLFHNQVQDEDALMCLRAAGSLVLKQPNLLLPRHLKLIRFIVTSDPRPKVSANVWLTFENILPLMIESTLHADFFAIVSMQLKPNASPTAHANALRVMAWFCVEQAQLPESLVTLARHIASESRLHRTLFSKVLSTCARRELIGIDTLKSAEEQGRLENVQYLNEVLQTLKLTRFVRDPRVWASTLSMVEDLTRAFPHLIANYVGECYMQLIRLCRRKRLDQMETALWRALSHISHHCSAKIAQNSHMLFAECAMSLDSKTKLAIAVCLIDVFNPSSVEDREKACNQCLHLTNDSDIDRYTLARVAMCRGSMALAGCLLKPIVEVVDNDVFGSWLRALIAISDSHRSIASEEFVTIAAHQKLTEARALLEAVVSGEWGFDFTIAFVDARLKWMELMLQAQQYVGELAHIRRCGGCRERRLRDSFRANADQFLMIRSRMFCASTSDRDVLSYHAQVSLLAAEAVELFSLCNTAKQEMTFDFPSLLASTNSFGAEFQTLTMIRSEMRDKAKRLHALDPTRWPLIGSTILAQLLRALCSIPSLTPQQFFRSQAKSSDRVRCNLQILTLAETSSTSSKPRSRSQLGVAKGTEFTSLLHGVIMFPRESCLRSKVSALRVTLTLVDEKCESDGIQGSTQQVKKITIPLALPRSTNVTTAWTSVPFEAPIVVPSDMLKCKGTFTIHATPCIIDTDGETWELAATGGRRGVIVY